MCLGYDKWINHNIYMLYKYMYTVCIAKRLEGIQKWLVTKPKQ
jgi:hypothetical protein